MLEQILTAVPPFPAYLHRHVLQLYLIKHRRPPRTEPKRRRAVYEYLTRGRRKAGAESCSRIHLGPALEAWLKEDDEKVRGWGPVPRLAALVYTFSRDLRKRYDLETERDYKEFVCYLALGVQAALRWPETIFDPALLAVLWEPAPGAATVSRVGVTRALRYVRRVARSVRQLDLSKPATPRGRPAAF